MRVIIAGSRFGVTSEQVFLAADEFVSQHGPIDVVISGDAIGADHFGCTWAELHSVPIEHYPADWKRFGKSAGFIRNKAMAKKAHALICVHCRTPGSIHMISEAKKLGLFIFEKIVEGYQWTPT